MKQQQFRVDVWFGDHKIIQRDSADPGDAAAFEQAMCRRWPSLRVTHETILVGDKAVSPWPR